MQTMKKYLYIWNCIIVGLSLASISFAEHKSPGLSDGEIIGIYNQVNSFDVETALLAMNQGYSGKVKELAAMVAADHRGVRKGAAELAASISADVSVPTAQQKAAADYYHRMADLAEKTNEEFDRAYLLHEIQFHSDAMKAVKKVLLPAASDPALKEHFETVLPHFEHHLNKTTQVAKDLGYVSD